MTGEELRDKMDQWGVTAGNVARHAGISVSQVTRELNGERTLMQRTADAIRELCDRRQCDIAAVSAVLRFSEEGCTDDPDELRVRGHEIVRAILTLMAKQEGFGFPKRLQW